MAGPLYCDAGDCGGYADVLVSQIADGTTLAWCNSHFVQMCAAIAESTVQAEADDAAAEALARLGAEPEAEAFPTSSESSDAGDQHDGSRSTPVSEPAEPLTGQDDATGEAQAPSVVPGSAGRSKRAG